MLVAGIGYVVVITIWIITLQVRAKTMLRVLSEMVDPELWEALGSPETLKIALQDPQRRWFKFLRSGEYRRQLDDVAIALIDDYRRRTKTMLLICAGAALLLLYRFWSILRPDFL